MIAVMGATGHTGRRITEILLESGEAVRALGRSREKLARLEKKGAEILTDFLPMEMDQIEAIMKEEGLLQIQDARGGERVSP